MPAPTRSTVDEDMRDWAARVIAGGNIPEQSFPNITEEVTEIPPGDLDPPDEVRTEQRGRQAVGACCPAEGDCFQTTQSECEASGGEYQGDGVSCNPSPCMGACCKPDDTCEMLSQSACDDAEGTWHGDATCDDDPDPCACPQTGAPTHVSMNASFVTIDDYVTDCNDNEISVSGTESYDFDLTFGIDPGFDLGSNCVACSDNSDTPVPLDFSCPDPPCSPENGTYSLTFFFCVFKDELGNWQIYIQAVVTTPEDFGICGWDTANGANLSFDPEQVDVGPNIFASTWTIVLNGGGYECSFNFNFS